MLFADAKYLIEHGFRLKHRFFADDEWISQKDGNIIFEDGSSMPSTEYWSWRLGKAWETVWGTDWDFYTDPVEPPKPVIRYCWLQMPEGKFSNSWSESDHDNLAIKEITNIQDKNWKLIRYECLTDSEFEFDHNMKLR